MKAFISIFEKLCRSMSRARISALTYISRICSWIDVHSAVALTVFDHHDILVVHFGRAFKRQDVFHVFMNVERVLCVQPFRVNPISLQLRGLYYSKLRPLALRLITIVGLAYCLMRVKSSLRIFCAH